MKPLVAGTFIACSFAAAGALAGEPEAISFSRQIQPILSENCYSCHGPDAEHRRADLRLDTREGALAVVEPGASGASELFRRISSDDEYERMPPAEANRQLSAEQIALLKRWIDAGAPWGKHWSFEPLARPEVPQVEPRGQGKIRNPIDAFVQAKLAREGLTPAPEASRETLIRRVTLDLTGLPPTPEEVEAFLNDDSPNAYERVVDRLLHSPAYGERMAWPWLDAARYADSNGYQGDRERTMWPWRDWVIDAFNRNLPYDKFTLWQLAGDLLPNPTFEQRLATGFLRNHMINGEGGRIAEENRVEYVMDMSETTGTVWLGLTFNCCRCHDHKFDSITQRNYYEFFAFFNQTPVTGGGGNPQTPPVLAAPSEKQKRRVEQLQRQLAELDEELEARREPRPPEPRPPEARSSEARLKAERERVEKQLAAVRKAIPKVMVMEDMAKPRKSYMLDRGLYNQRGAEVTADVPESLPPLPDGAPANRLGLARWLVSSDNPLTARVTVNRFWQQVFGVGLVKTPADFGVQGEIPPQMDLLNWLAAEFRDGGWNVRALMRLIVTSHTYRQSSKISSPADYERDPENRLLARGPRFRMPYWMIRDQALAASGLLARRVGGEPVNSYQPPGVWEEATFGKKKYKRDHRAALYRRSLYTFWRRIIAPTMFFDNASRQVCTVQISRTNTPLQALYTFNDVTFVEAARALAEAALLRTELSDAERVDFIFRRLLARPAKPEETKILLAGLNRSRGEFADNLGAAKKLLAMGESPRREKFSDVEHASWTALCLAVFNLDETLTKE